MKRLAWQILLMCILMCGLGAYGMYRYLTIHSDNMVYRHVYFTPGPDCENIIIDQINQSRRMDIAVYSITNPAIGDAIIEAQKRGAHIRIISDRTQAANKASLIKTFQAAGIPVALNHGHKIEHNKFVIFNNKTVVTGSYNWTTNATKYNSENCLIQQGLVREYSVRFNELWAKYTSY